MPDWGTLLIKQPLSKSSSYLKPHILDSVPPRPGVLPTRGIGETHRSSSFIGNAKKIWELLRKQKQLGDLYSGVSKNRGIPKWMVDNAKPY